MVYLVTQDNRHLYGAELAAMHRDRKRFFVDKLKWKFSVVDGEFEIDQFDTADAVYLLVLDSARRHLGSARLLPSSMPHALGQIFSELCAGDVPGGEDVWEITRVCISPDLSEGEAARVFRLLGAGLVECGLLYGISNYTCVTRIGVIPQILAMGWECEPLGLPKCIDGETIAALSVLISPTTLKNFRAQYGASLPILTIERPPVSASASAA